MKYYKLTTIGANRNEIGISPQSKDGYFGDIQKDFMPFEGKIDFDFDLPIPKLQDKAKLTTMLDVVMIPTKFLVVQNQFLEFLKKFEITYNQQWSIKVEYKKTFIEDYSLFYLTETKQADYIDFKKSEFYVGSLKDYTFIGDDINISDYQNYLSTFEVLKSDGLWLKHKKVVLNLSRAKEDIFRIINTPSSGYFISEKLREALIKKGFTGMVFKEITNDKKVEVIY
ncbi:MAG: hypothetical protein GW817_11870 [Flavobacteriales bacterium]|nr:hypothetical protein [Flavobacteriales bacterium]NCP83301.1 hypothetical protein [Bacteroidota bacterium]NCQ10623.1 hypothetical protein [Bacteroidota bacterium]PIV93795.1 MAG: hypothetical protein COW44_07610 [Flavobacteriaceae bacterium CG17_big_fil_post_rev_8_21_14_2_50_33_15]